MTTSGSTPTTGPDTPILHVAVGVLRRADGRVLVADRDAARHAGGGLEFPGGKIEPGESVEAGLARELAEELGVHVAASRPLLRLRHDYPERRVELHVRVVDAWTGEPTGREGQPVHWRAPAALETNEFPAANRPIIAALRWPARLRVTPAITASEDVSGLVERVIAAGESGDWIQVRAPELGPTDWRNLVERIRAGVDATAATRILLNTTPDDPLIAATGFGLHLRAAHLRPDDAKRWQDPTLVGEDAKPSQEPNLVGGDSKPLQEPNPVGGDSKPLQEPNLVGEDSRPSQEPNLVGASLLANNQRPRVLTCAAHTPNDLQAAQRLGVDFAVVGNVRATASHPGRAGIGWAALGALTATTSVPVYAIGGVTPHDLGAARDRGAVGVAGISAFWSD